MEPKDKKPIITVQDLTYIYPDGTLALDGVNLKIYDEEIVGIIGQNGSGKTTLVKHFNGLLKPTKGKVVIDGVDTSDKTVAQLSTKVGYVFQNPDHQICQFSVVKEVSFGLTNLKVEEAEIERRVHAALAAVGIEKLAQRHPLLLSKGERQRIAIASVLAMRPRILIIDEPTTGQDHRQSREIMNLISDLSEEGHTVLVISHNMNLIAEYTKRVLVLSRGKVILDGPPSYVFRQKEALEEAFIKPPQITRLAQMLERYRIPPEVLSVQEMYEVFKKVYES